MVFNPQLSEPSAASGGGSVVPPLDLSAVGRLGEDILAGFQRKRQAEQQASDNRAYVDVSNQAINLQNARLQEEMFAADVQARAAGVDALGEIDSQEEQMIFDQFQRDLQRVNNSRRGGLLNDSAYRIRLNNLLSRAQNASPGLAREFERLTGFDADRLQAPETQGQAQAATYLDNVYGQGNWGAREFIAENKRQLRISRVAQNKELGYADAAAIRSDIPVEVADSIAPLTGQVIQLLSNQGGALTPEQQQELSLRVGELRRQLREGAATDIQNASSTGSIISQKDSDSIYSEIDSNMEYLNTLINDNNVFEKLKKYQEYDQTKLNEGLPVGFNEFKEALGSSGIGGVNALLQLLPSRTNPSENDPVFQQAVKELGGPDFGGSITREEVSNFINRNLQGVLRGERFQDESRRRMQLAIGMKVMSSPGGSNLSTLPDGSSDTGAPAAGSAEQEIAKAMIEASGVEVIEHANPRDAVRTYLNPIFAANTVKSLTPESRSMLKNNLDLWSRSLLRGLIDASETGNRLFTISLNDSGQFEATPSRVSGGGQAADALRASQQFDIAQVQDDIQLLNELTTFPTYTGIAPTAQEVNRAFEAITAEREQAQTVTRVDAEATDFFAQREALRGFTFDPVQGRFVGGEGTDADALARANTFVETLGEMRVMQLIAQGR